MDVRIYAGRIELPSCDSLTRDELDLIILLMGSGRYWELRRHGEHLYTLHDDGNDKMKGSMAQIKRQMGLIG